MIRNQSGQVIGAEMIQAANGLAFSGLVTVFVTVDNQAQALGSVGNGIATAAGNGLYQYQPSQNETNGNLIAFTFTGSGAVPVSVEVATVTPSQQSALSTATGGLSTPVATIVSDAFREIAVYTSFLSPPPDDFAFALGKLNRLFDNMSDDRRLTFSQSFTSYPLTPNLQPHTIGPNSATFTATTRPIEIRAAQLVLTDVTPNVFVPIQVKDWAWWSHVPVRAISTSIPTHLYYQPDWPNGSIFLWPVPTIAYQIEIVTRVSFAQVGATDVFWMPPGYRDYVTLKLAASLVGSYPGAIVAPTLMTDLRDAESRIFNANLANDLPDLDLIDAGMPGHGGGSETMNYRSRTFN